MAVKTTRQRYLESVVDCILDNGRTDLPLVSLAEAAGTSDRMLVYYFKTRDALLTEAIQSIRSRRRTKLAEYVGGLVSTDDVADGLRDVLRWVASEENAADVRLFYDAAGRAMHDEAPFDDFLADSIRDWVEEGAEAARGLGADETRAIAFGTLLGATAQSLAADRLATGDIDRIDEAIEPAASALMQVLSLN